MPRRPRHCIGNHVFHALNRAIQGALLFDRPADYQAFLETLAEAVDRFHIDLYAYTLMPNHWHLVVKAADDTGMSDAMHWLCTVHAQRRRVSTNSRGRGAVYQGRFKAIAVQDDHHFLTVCRYVERNPLRARLVPRAEDWAWSSAATTATGIVRPTTAPWLVTRPDDWLDLLNQPEPADELKELRACVAACKPFGNDSWQRETLGELSWQSGRRGRGRPSLRDSAERPAHRQSDRLHLCHRPAGFIEKPPDPREQR